MVFLYFYSDVFQYFKRIFSAFIGISTTFSGILNVFLRRIDYSDNPHL